MIYAIAIAFPLVTFFVGYLLAKKWWYSIGFRDGSKHGIELMNRIAKIPASNVVEVVRCRDCVFGNMPCAMSRYPDYFCADGKRKDGGQDDV